LYQGDLQSVKGTPLSTLFHPFLTGNSFTLLIQQSDESDLTHTQPVSSQLMHPHTCNHFKIRVSFPLLQ